MQRCLFYASRTDFLTKYTCEVKNRSSAFLAKQINTGEFTKLTYEMCTKPAAPEWRDAKVYKETKADDFVTDRNPQAS